MGKGEGVGKSTKKVPSPEDEHHAGREEQVFTVIATPVFMD